MGHSHRHPNEVICATFNSASYSAGTTIDVVREVRFAAALPLLGSKRAAREGPTALASQNAFTVRANQRCDTLAPHPLPITNASTLVRPSWRIEGQPSLAVKREFWPQPERWAGAHGRGC